MLNVSVYLETDFKLLSPAKHYGLLYTLKTYNYETYNLNNHGCCTRCNAITNVITNPIKLKAMSNSFQKTTKNGRPIINRATKTPVYTLSLHARMKANTYKLNEGLSKFDSVFSNICRNVQTLQLSTY